MTGEASARGIIAAGNFIVDHVKLIDGYPEQDTRATILSEKRCNGGGPYNELKDLAMMGAGFPLEGVGLVGGDELGAWIRKDCKHLGIGAKGLQEAAGQLTSYTDAMTVAATGRRTFFHHRGANAEFSQAHVRQAFVDLDVKRKPFRLFYLGYLMLLDALDALDAEGKTEAGGVLAMAKEEGMETIVDLVSTDHENYGEVVGASLPHTDHLLLNEWEAEKAVGFAVATSEGCWDWDALQKAGAWLFDKGLQKRAIFHSVQGAVAMEKSGAMVEQPSLRLPEGYVVGATGAGAAFAAGYLLGVHESWSLPRCLRTAVCAAAMSLRDASPSDGLESWEKGDALWKLYGKESDG